VVLVMDGATPVTVRLKSCGPSLPVPFVAVTWRVLTATAFGVPVSIPALESDAHPGSPVPLQVIGAEPPAANWNEYPVPNVPFGSGLVEVIVGATGGVTTVRLKLCGPSVPATFDAVTARIVVVLTFGVPVRRPLADRLAHAGSPVADHVTGLVPVAANWNEYGVPFVPPGSGLMLVITGGIPAIVREKFVGPALPAEFVARTDMVVVATAFGVPFSKPAEDKVAQLGKPVALQVIVPEPVAANANEYGVPMVPDGSGFVVVITGALEARRHPRALSIPGAPNASP